MERPRERHVYAGRQDVGPYHASPMSTPHALSAPMVGRDVLGAPRPRNAHRDAHGNATCTRAAGDVGPYHASPMSTPHALSTPTGG